MVNQSLSIKVKAPESSKAQLQKTKKKPQWGSSFSAYLKKKKSLSGSSITNEKMGGSKTEKEDLIQALLGSLKIEGHKDSLVLSKSQKKEKLQDVKLQDLQALSEQIRELLSTGNLEPKMQLEAFEGLKNLDHFLDKGEIPQNIQNFIKTLNLDKESQNTLLQVLKGDMPSLSLEKNPMDLKKETSSKKIKLNKNSIIKLDDQRQHISSDLKDNQVFILKQEPLSQELSLELTGFSQESFLPDGQGRSYSELSLEGAKEAKGLSFLSEQLEKGGIKDLAKSINFTLKDDHKGEIKLILKPEALGKVKINLNLNENHIVGKIIVENSSVRDIFLNNLDSLSKALEEQGFSNTKLDVSVGDYGQSPQERSQEKESPLYFTKREESFLESVPTEIQGESSLLSQINLVV